MEAIRLTETASTPQVVLDKQSNEFSFHGRTLPANPKEFYTPIINWFNEYFKNPNSETNVVFDIEYMNTASLKMILEMMRMFKRYISAGIIINIKWIYEENDEEVFKTGRDFSEMVGIPIVLARKSLD